MCKINSTRDYHEFQHYLVKPEEYFAYKKDTEIGPC